MGLDVLLLVPNIIGYLRLLCLLVSWFYYYQPGLLSAAFYALFMIGDALDGYAARKLNQASAFGAWLDIVIDLLGRGMLWCRLYDFGYLIMAVEWLCFVCTHTLGDQWKTAFVNEPFFVKAVMAKGYKTPTGMFAIAGLHGLPFYLYCYYSDVMRTLKIPKAVQYAGIGLLSAGRALAMAVEMWVIYSHILFLTSAETSRPAPDKRSQPES